MSPVMRSAATKWIKRSAVLVRRALPLVLAALIAPLSYWLVSEVGPAQRLYGDTEDWMLGLGWRTVVLPVALAGAFFGAVVLAVRQTGFVIDPIVPLLGCALGCGLTWAGKGATASLWKQSEGALTEAAILFCDIEDSTGLTRRLGPEGYQALYAQFIATSDSVVRRNDGELERTTGDGFVAVFRPHRHHPVDRAVKAAEEILTATATLAKSSLGMEFGRVSGAYVSEGGREVWSSAGETANLAKRLHLCETVPPSGSKSCRRRVPCG
ncbi:MAG: adenylate/guanylate cyclase domain-containing protein [Fimbriimonadaceae bacterium]|nr:adenylate/guanylate cyclase domain-containing protein [Fimbriimonadaceae bacterium]QYK55113.1 MAG: adenylate/guanylate cyclase domain-containing protein [Fimbriimonadaceae bacterium]